LVMALLLAAIAAETPCTVSVVVVDDTNKPVIGAEVALRSRKGGESVFNTGRNQPSIAARITDRSGAVSFNDLVAGPDYYVVARFPALGQAFTTVKCSEPPSEPTRITLHERMDVSLVQLIANPAAWHDRYVRVIGFLNLEFEGDALYLHEDDWKHVVSRNAIWVDMHTATAACTAERGYVIMEGVFDGTSYGHMGLFSGTLTKIDRCVPWRLRAR
jgi:hypothetical protein